jgi:hypothetical protein
MTWLLEAVLVSAVMVRGVVKISWLLSFIVSRTKMKRTIKLVILVGNVVSKMVCSARRPLT